MPIYEYQCEACGKVTDIRHGFDERTNEACPACGGGLARRFSPAGIVFKGSGFYVTDSRKPGDSGKSSGSKPEGTTESKTESKADSPTPSSTGPADGSGGSGGGAAKSETAAA